MIIKPATATINCQRWLDNLDVVKKLAPKTKIMAIAKADAYGIGMLEYAKTIESNIDMLGVARQEEAFFLRDNGINKPILLLEGFFDSLELNKLAEYNIETVVHNDEQLTAILNSHLNNPIKVWLKIDS